MSTLTSLRTAELSRRPDNYRKFKVTLIILSEENRLLNIHTHTHYGAQREGNLCEDGATDELDCGIEKLKLFFFLRLIFFLFPIQVQPNRENTVNIKSIINIYNLHILKILSITKMWGDKLTAAGWSGCDLHATESLSLPSPFCF